MASAIAFDTHSYVKKLRDAGVSEQQAEVQAEALVALIEDRLATKKELFGVEAALKRDIKELEANLRRDMKELETSLKRDLKELETSLKRDMAELGTSLRRDMTEMETSLRRDMQEMEMRLLIRLGALMVAGFGVIATLIKIL